MQVTGIRLLYMKEPSYALRASAWPTPSMPVKIVAMAMERMRIRMGEPVNSSVYSFAFPTHAHGLDTRKRKEKPKNKIVISGSRGAWLMLGQPVVESVQPHASLVTPIKGGTGPVTVAALVQNVFRAAVKGR